MARTDSPRAVSIGVLALQGAFSEHIQLLQQAAATFDKTQTTWRFLEVRTVKELDDCDALIIPGGESTAISLLAQRSGLLESLRAFVKLKRKPVWGTCAGLILLAESANRTKKGGQELIGGLDVRVNRNHFGRQVESFEAELEMNFLSPKQPFRTIFIRAPVVEQILPQQVGEQVEEAKRTDTVVAPSLSAEMLSVKSGTNAVEVMARLPPHAVSLDRAGITARDVGEDGDIVAVRQGNVFGTAFHPELTGDSRIHAWWLREVSRVVER